jgi:hypothetical protein
MGLVTERQMTGNVGGISATDPVLIMKYNDDLVEVQARGGAPQLVPQPGVVDGGVGPPTALPQVVQRAAGLLAASY